MITDFNKIVREWSYRVDDGKPNPYNSAHLYHLSQVLIENKWPYNVIDELLQNLAEQDSEREKLMKKVIKYKDKEGNDREITVGGALKQGEEHPAYKQAKQITQKDEKPKGDKVDEPSDFDRDTKQNKGVDPSYARDDKGEEKTKSTSQKIDDNRRDIFNNTVSGKGGGETSLQEEIAGISRELAHKYPNDSQEEHEKRVKKFIQDNFGDTKFGKKESTIDRLVKKSASGIKTMKKIKSNKGMKFDENQPEGYPKNLTFTDGGTAAVRELLEEKVKNAKTPEEKKHYETE